MTSIHLYALPFQRCVSGAPDIRAVAPQKDFAS